jgi:hypothetical protein
MLLLSISIEEFQKGLSEIEGNSAVLSGFVLCLCACIFVAWRVLEWAYMKIIGNLESDVKSEEKEKKRLEAKITALEKQLQKQLNPTQSLLKPFSVIEVSEVHEKNPKLLPAGLTDGSVSQAELRIQALQTANELYRVIEEGKRQASQLTHGLEIGADLLYQVRPNDLRSLQYKDILESILSCYSKNLHDKAVMVKSKILVSDKTNFLPTNQYTNPQGLRSLEVIYQDLKDIGTSPFTQP